MAPRLGRLPMGSTFCLYLASAFAQSSTDMPTSSTPPPSTITSPPGRNATASAIQANSEWLQSQVDDFVLEGMKSAAASYLVEQRWTTNSEGHNYLRANEESIMEDIVSYLHDGEIQFAEGNRITLEGYFLDLLPTGGPREYESSFLSVWRSYQGVTLDASESVRLNKLRSDAIAAATSTTALQGSGGQGAEINLGVAAGVAGAVAAFLKAI